MDKIKNIVTGHLSTPPSGIHKHQIEKISQVINGHHYMLSSQAVSKDGREQAIYIKEYQDASLAGKPFCGCITNLAQDDKGSSYQITGINEGPQVIGQALEEHF